MVEWVSEWYDNVSKNYQKLSHYRLSACQQLIIYPISLFGYHVSHKNIVQFLWFFHVLELIMLTCLVLILHWPVL